MGKKNPLKKEMDNWRIFMTSQATLKYKLMYINPQTFVINSKKYFKYQVRKGNFIAWLDAKNILYIIPFI